MPFILSVCLSSNIFLVKLYFDLDLKIFEVDFVTRHAENKSWNLEVKYEKLFYGPELQLI